MMTSLAIKLSWYSYVALLSCLYLSCHLSEFINNLTQSMGKTRGDIFPCCSISPFSFVLDTTAFENFEYPWDVQVSMLPLLRILNVFQVYFRVKQLFTILSRDLP